MEIMKNSRLLLLACLVIPLAAMAVTPPAKPASAVAKAAVPALSASTLRAEVKGAAAPRQLMASCEKKASAQSLQDVERKTFLTACMAGK